MHFSLYLLGLRRTIMFIVFTLNLRFMFVVLVAFIKVLPVFGAFAFTVFIAITRRACR